MASPGYYTRGGAGRRATCASIPIIIGAAIGTWRATCALMPLVGGKIDDTVSAPLGGPSSGTLPSPMGEGLGVRAGQPDPSAEWNMNVARGFHTPGRPQVDNDAPDIAAIYANYAHKPCGTEHARTFGRFEPLPEGRNVDFAKEHGRIALRQHHERFEREPNWGPARRSRRSRRKGTSRG